MIPIKDDNPTRITPYVTWTLLAINIGVFALQFSVQSSGGPQAAQEMIYSFGLVPAVLIGERQLPPEIAVLPAEATIFTSMFMHGGLLHLGGNMLYLWIFGNNIEDSMGHGRFIVFYLLCGIAAAFAQVAVNPGSTVPMVGASGAISGVLGAYLLLFPRAHVLVLLPIFVFIQILRLPALIVLGLWFVFQLLSGVSAGAGTGGGVAFWAHIGGFVAGMALIFLFRKDGFAGARRHSGGRGGRGPWG
ncbi:MAG: rhomboid family intramembrane serine protease [Rhodovibrionaceae bacterium]|nr:rhomboid family intramembrane serine protease [Rhodovibrionaceae bacterium]